MFELLHTIIALPSDGGSGGGASSILNLVIPFALVFGIMYFLVIRPQQKRASEQQTFLSSLKKGDQVVTQGGIFGTISAVTGHVITLEISDRVRVQVLRSSIVSRRDQALADADAAARKAGGGGSDKKEEPKADSTSDEASASSSEEGEEGGSDPKAGKKKKK